MYPIVIEVERKIYVHTIILLNVLNSKETYYYHVHRLKHIYFATQISIHNMSMNITIIKYSILII